MSASVDTLQWLAACRRRASEFHRLTVPPAHGRTEIAQACAAAYDTAADVPALLNHIDDLNRAIDRIVGAS